MTSTTGAEGFARSLRPAATSRHHDAVQRRKSRGEEMLEVSGIPLWPPPRYVLARAQDRLLARPLMPPAGGFESLREAVASKRQKISAGDHSPAEILVTNGAKEAIHLTLSVLCETGTTVVVPSPNYLYQGNCEALHLHLHRIPEDASTGFPAIAELVEAIKRDRPAVVLTSNPVNPTGYVWRESDLAQLVAACRDCGSWLVLDESFEELVPTSISFTAGDSFRELYTKIVTIHSFSKGYGIPWARIGYLVADTAFVEAAGNLQEWTSLRVNAYSQYLAEEALHTEGDGWLAERRARSIDSRAAVRGIVDGIEAAWAVQGDAGGSLFVYLSSKSQDGAQVAELLLDRGIGAVPGEVFGARQASLRIPSICVPELLPVLSQRLVDVLGPLS